MTGWRRALFPTVIVLVLLAQLAIVVPGLYYTRLWEDEAYNLTVPLNLLAGHGYASAGILAGGGPLPFDARISTGPTVLLPVIAMLATGIDPVLGGRIVMVLFYAALLVGLWLLGHRIAGRWGGLAALVVPLGLNTNQLPSPVQGPTDILGELPAAMFLVFAVYLYRRHPLWAGLLAGLAIQTKFIAVLGVPAIMLAVFLSATRERLGRRIWRAVFCGLMALIPTALYELWQFVALGWGGFVSATRQFGAFLLNGGQGGVHAGAGSKAVLLAQSWFVPWWVVVVVVVVAVAAGVAATLLRRRRTVEGTVEAGSAAHAHLYAALLHAALLALVVWLGWWMLSAHTPAWVRYPTPVLLAFVPVLAALLVLGIRELWRRPARGLPARGLPEHGLPARGLPARWLAGGVVALLVVVVGAQAVLHTERTWTPQRGETLPQQRHAASAIATLGESQLQSAWGGGVSIAVMAGAKSRLTDATKDPNVPLVLVSYGHTDAARAAFANRVGSSCASVLLRTGDYVVCLPR